MNEWLWNGKPWQAFKNFAIVFSFVLNLVFLVLIILGARYIIPVTNEVAEPVVSPVQTDTVATILEPVPMTIPTQFVLPGGGGYINGSVSLSLPAGTALPVKLDVVVPVSQTVPIAMEVAVDIPLSETELSQPFGDLRQLFAPLDYFLTNLPSSNAEAYERLIGAADEQAEAAPADSATSPAMTSDTGP
jgi:hypothetical protein